MTLEIDKKLEQAIQLAKNESDVVEAERIFEELKRDYPSSTEVLHRRAWFYSRQEHLEKAAQELSEIIKLSPDDIVAYAMRGRWYSGLRRYSEAVSDQTKVLELGAKTGNRFYEETAFFFRALAFCELGEFDSAILDTRFVTEDLVMYMPGLGQISRADLVERCRGHE